MGDVGAVATLLNTLAGWAFDPQGYAQLSRERKLKEIHDGAIVALQAGHWDVLDRLLAELRRLQQEAP